MEMPQSNKRQRVDSSELKQENPAQSSKEESEEGDAYMNIGKINPSIKLPKSN